MEYLAFKIGNNEIKAPTGLPDPNKINVDQIIKNALSIFITAGVAISLIFVVWAGVRWITSGGDKQKLASARAQLTWAIIGLIIIFLSFFIINLISYVFNVKLLDFPF